MAKKSVEELDAELAQLEAELEALETGAAPPKPKAKKKPKAKPAPPPEPEPEAPKKRFGLPKRAKKEEAPPVDAELEPPAGEPPRKRFGLPKPAKKEAPAEAAEPEEEAPRGLLGRRRGPEPQPEPAQAPLGWERRGDAWRAQPQGPQKIEVVRRELDSAGRVVSEEAVAEQYAEPEAPPPPPRRFGLRRKAGEPGEPIPRAVGEERRRRRGWIVFPVIILLLLLFVVVAVALPYLGSDPTGLGGRLGIGPGGGGGGLPVATFSIDAPTAAVGQPVNFDALGSRDPAGGQLEHNWDFGDGGGATGERVNHTYVARGTYTVTLTVRTASGREAQHREPVVVLPPPSARIALALGGSPVGGENSPVAGQSLDFDGAGSTAEGGVRAYSWTFGDGARATGSRASHAYAQPGSYRATLEILDGAGLRGNASVTIYVGSATTTAGEVPAGPLAPQAVNVTVQVTAGGGALPFLPASLRVTLTYNGTGAGGNATPVPVPVPAPVPVGDLDITIYDAAGKVVARSSGAGSPKTVTVTDFSGALGDWHVEVSRAQALPQGAPFTLAIRLLHGPP